MSILLNPGSFQGPTEWLAAFQNELPGTEIVLWPDTPDPASVEFVIAVRHDPADLHNYPNLRAVLAMGAGVEQYTGAVMPDVPVVRLHDPHMSNEMAAYVAHWVVHFQRRFDAYLGNQSDRTWRNEPYVTCNDYPVGILGFGRIGMRIGEVLNGLGFPINAWSRTGTFEPWATSFAGLDELDHFLGASAAIVNVLPSTKATHKLMNADRFAQMQPGALFVNLGRGATADETDLLAALDAGQVGAAVLDVTDPEPMEPDNALWTHPRVRVTPHVAGETVIASASKVIAANIRRIREGKDPYPVAQRDRGY